MQKAKKSIISKSSAAVILTNAGAVRVAAKAAEELSILLSEMTNKNAVVIAEEAVKIARYSGRKTVTKEDIKAAVK